MNADQEIDVRGLNCPMPVLRTKKALNAIAAGQVLKVTATDPASVKDIAALAQQTGNELLESATAGDEFVFYLKKGVKAGTHSTAPKEACEKTEAASCAA